MTNKQTQPNVKKSFLDRLLDREESVIDDINTDASDYSKCKWNPKDFPLLLNKVFWYGRIAQQKGRKLFSEDLTERVHEKTAETLRTLAKSYLDSIKPIQLDQAIEFIANPFRYIEFTGFKRYLPSTTERKRDADVQNETGFVRMPQNTNIYGRNAEQEGLEFRMMGPISCKIKGEFLIFDPDKIPETILYFDFKEWQQIFGFAMEKEKEFHYDFNRETATLKNYSEIIKRIVPKLSY